MKQLSDDAIVITGIGMCSSLGNAVTACAAARTGLAAGAELDDFWVRDEDDVEQKAIGHPVRTAEGFQGFARLLCLARPALEDLLQDHDLRSLDLGRTGLYLCLPDRAARHVGGEGSPEPTGSKRSSGLGLCTRLIQLCSLAIPRDHWNQIEHGRTGIVRAVREASVALRSGKWRSCLVGGIDSLLELQTLEWLRQTGQMKTPTKPDGLRPGEAAAFALLERFDSARHRKAQVLAVLAGASLSQDQHHEGAGERTRGAAIVETVVQLLASRGASVQADAWIISDHNGEYHRACALGSALAQLAQQLPSLVAKPRWLPAMSFGDTGAASAAVAICMAARGFARRYAPAPSAILLSSERGELGALRLDAPDIESIP